jgi:hypothetical protein
MLTFDLAQVPSSEACCQHAGMMLRERGLLFTVPINQYLIQQGVAAAHQQYTKRVTSITEPFKPRASPLIFKLVCHRSKASVYHRTTYRQRSKHARKARPRASQLKLELEHRPCRIKSVHYAAVSRRIVKPISHDRGRPSACDRPAVALAGDCGEKGAQQPHALAPAAGPWSSHRSCLQRIAAASGIEQRQDEPWRWPVPLRQGTGSTPAWNHLIDCTR